MIKSERLLKSIGRSTVPNGWKWKRIDECFDIIKRRNDNNCENVLTISSISGFVNQKERFSKVIAGENLKKYTLLRKGEFSYNKGNSKTFPCGCIFLLEDYEEAAIPNVYISFKNKDEISNKFYRYYFQNKLLDGQLKRLINTGVRNDGLLNINTDEFCGVYILVPPIKEQEKIAEILSTWDLAIEKQERLIEKKKELKKGLMQRLLSEEIRFNEYCDVWREYKLKDIGDIITGGTPDTSIDKYYGDEYIWVTPSDITDRKYIDKSARMLSKEGLSKIRKIKKDSLLITCIASIGKNAVLRQDGGCNQQINALTTYNGFDVEFLYYLICYKENYIKMFAGKSATQIINKDTLGSLKFKIPSYNEQRKIAEILALTDKEIELLQKELEALKLQKKGLMQRLLTGEVRVKV
ncbi:MAG: restriction endonuclease subunit S [Clostridium neonatale]